MGARELLARGDFDFDAQSVELDDAAVLESLEPEVREWWVEEFGEYAPENGGFFTPPQKETIPHVRDGTNALVASPTGSGKCVKPDTPLIVEDNGTTEVLRAEELLERRGRKIADVDEDGELHTSDINAFSLSDGEIEKQSSLVYDETYSGEIHKIETVYGREVEVTPDHPLLVETSDGPEWRRAEDIEKGDQVGVPAQIDLPERSINLDITHAIEELRDQYPVVLTHEDYARLSAALKTADSVADLAEREARESLALADLSMNDVSERLSVSIATVHNQVTHDTDYKTDELLSLLQSEIEPLDENEIAVKTTNGRISRFTYPKQMDTELSMLCAFVLAEGLVANYEKSGFVMLSQTKQSGLLEDARRVMRDRFDVTFRAKNEKDYLVEDQVFALFFSELLDIDLGPGRDVRLPSWVLNAPSEVKRSFVSTFFSLDAEIRENEVRLTQANEMKIEQFAYLLLSFGVLPARGTTTKCATNTDEQIEREYYRLTVRGKNNLRTLVSEFDISHPNMAELATYATGDTSGSLVGKHAFDYEDIRKLSRYFADDDTFDEALGNVYEVVRRSGYITNRSLSRLESVLEKLPDEGPAKQLSQKIGAIRERNVTWLEVTSKKTVTYEGQIIDLTVPDTHNFVGGRGGMYLHNTLASFTAILNELFRREREQAEGLDNSVYCLYVSPLKSLANDIHRNLEVPLRGIAAKIDGEPSVRHAIRHGDTDDAARRKMLEETPHILNTTPETLAILLNSPKFKQKLESVEYVVVDEIHSLADGKRGTHLAVSLERLEQMAETSPTRIGCSATVEPLADIAEFLVGCESDGTTANDARESDAGASEAGADAGGSKGDESECDESDADESEGDESENDGATPRDCEIVDTRFVREFDIELQCPTDDLIDTPRDVVNERFYDQLHDLVSDHTNTLVFTNTRSGAERVLQNLRERYDAYDEDNSGCHHGSLSKEARQSIEQDLKDGTLDVVTTSTSLELGIDMPHIDLVVQVGSPKSVASLLQRVGRAGHQLGQTVAGRVIALDRDELVECAVMLKKAEEGFVDRVFVPEEAYDVAAQHVYGMAINEVRPEREVREILRGAYPYRNFSDEQFETLFRYLTSDYEGLEEKNVYAKIWRDENDPPDGEYHYPEFDVGEPLVGKRGRLARVIYMTNIGTIPDSFTCDVLTRSDDEWVGDLDEEYLDTLEKGDVFVLGGQHFEYQYRRGSKVYVDRTSGRPTVPSWFSERLPLSYDLGRGILDFQGELLEKFRKRGKPAVRVWLREFPLDENSVRAIARMFDEQIRYAGPESVSTDRRLAVEVELDRDEYERHYYVHSNYGRKFNDGLSRVVAYRCANAANTNVSVAVADHGFTVSMPLNRKVDVAEILRDIAPEDVRSDLRSALDGTDLLQRYFRINATRSLMILKRYKGYEKSASEQQVSSEMLLGFAEDLEEFAVIEETYREIIEDKLAVSAIEDVVAALQSGDVEVVQNRVDTPTPRAFGLATLMASDVVLAEDESAVLQEFHDRVLDEIGGEYERGGTGGASAAE